MLRNIITYIFIIIGICGVFFVATLFNNDIGQMYPEPHNVNFLVDYNVQKTESLDFTLANTVISKDEGINDGLFDDCYYALLIDDTNNHVFAAKDVHKRMYPASMTKLMTAIVVCDKIKQGDINLDDLVTVEKRYDLTSEGVLPCHLSVGCKISVKDLLYGLLIQSNNYYALILADYICGDTDTFCNLMNQKAYSIGATNTNFKNPHGLDNPEHYSTAYDIYLIAKEAYEYDLIKEIDSYESYSYSYINQAGYPIGMDIAATNLFMSGDVNLPANFDIKVWKTGTTDGAGNCLVMYLTKGENTYIAVLSNGESRLDLYDSMVKLICLIG